MPDWEKDSPQLRANLTEILAEISSVADRREKPTVEAARHWQALAMRNLEVREKRFVGAFRGERGLENVNVRVGANYGVDPADVGEALELFEAKLQMLVAELDAVLPSGQALNPDHWQPSLIFARGHIPSGCESIHLPMATDEQRGCGQISWRCVTGCHRLSGCVRGRTQVTDRLASKRCRVTGSQRRRCFTDCSKIFWRNIDSGKPTTGASFYLAEQARIVSNPQNSTISYYHRGRPCQSPRCWPE